jgi:hypothetical protein
VSNRSNIPGSYDFAVAAKRSAGVLLGSEKAEEREPGRRGLGFDAVSSLEALDAAGGVDDLLLAGVQGMAVGANLDMDFGARGTGLDPEAAGAHDCALLVCWMNSLFHDAVSIRNREL